LLQNPKSSEELILRTKLEKKMEIFNSSIAEMKKNHKSLVDDYKF
jgi:hypothetical protein